jgi:hypothetical protein
MSEAAIRNKKAPAEDRGFHSRTAAIYFFFPSLSNEEM